MLCVAALAVTGGARDQAPDIQIAFQFCAKLFLAPNLVGLRWIVILVSRPGHIRDLIPRAQVFFRRAVAVQAPFHQECALLVNRLHVVDATMATGTPNTFGHVNAVVKICEIGKAVKPFPFD